MTDILARPHAVLRTYYCGYGCMRVSMLQLDGGDSRTCFIHNKQYMDADSGQWKRFMNETAGDL